MESEQPLQNIGKKYKLIYIDPPWRYEFQKSNNRKIENHYPTMTLSEIMALPIPDLSDSDCIMFMWTTSPKLKESLKLMEYWGFEYRTHLIWDKLTMGTGFWFRGQHEILLLGKKGNIPIPEATNNLRSVYREQKKKHSRKPHYFYSLFEKLFPEYDKVEIFARNRRQGWDAWGNQVPKEQQNILTNS